MSVGIWVARGLMSLRGKKMLAILKYWQVIAGACVALFFAYLLHLAVLNSRLAAQEIQLKASCRKAQTLSYEVSNEYQANLSDLADRLSDLNRVRSCVPIPGPTCGCDGPTKGQGYGGSHGVDSQTLYKYAGDAERYRLQLIACQNFVKGATE